MPGSWAAAVDLARAADQYRVLGRAGLVKEEDVRRVRTAVAVWSGTPMRRDAR